LVAKERTRAGRKEAPKLTFHLSFLPTLLFFLLLLSAAIYGVRGKADISIFMLFPTGRVSAIQEAQMTSILDSNVHCLSVEGTFDDCQVRLSLSLLLPSSPI